MKNVRKIQKKIALERIQILYLNAIHYSIINKEIGLRQLELIKRLSLKFNLRLPYPYKLFFCKNCKMPIFPGIDSKIRISNIPRLHIKVICLKCNGVYRLFLN
ncbi:MAG: RNase P subunit [Nitrososphaeria archaeon]|nr:RNase P subunit [Nitrososphaeria archaeon]